MEVSLFLNSSGRSSCKRIKCCISSTLNFDQIFFIIGGSLSDEIDGQFLIILFQLLLHFLNFLLLLLLLLQELLWCDRNDWGNNFLAFPLVMIVSDSLASEGEIHLLYILNGLLGLGKCIIELVILLLSQKLKVVVKGEESLDYTFFINIFGFRDIEDTL